MTRVWQKALAQAVTSVDELCARVGVDPSALGIAQAEDVTRFPLRVPESFIARMSIGNPNDPLLLQVLPQAKEYVSAPGYSSDPLAEAEQNPIPGVLHKYRSRVLVMPTGACAVHCRYCFRRHFPYQERGLSGQHWSQIRDYIRKHPDVNEVIFSGGDPLLVSDSTLTRYFEELAALPQLKRIRLHTRVPIVLPERLTDAFFSVCESASLPLIVMVHSNHPQELSQELCDRLKAFSETGVRLYNQTVLLKGINDDSTVLAELSERLWEASVQPYYLHLLDAVAGAQHFDISVDWAKTIHRTLRSILPGFLVPNLVREEPHALAKTII